eukprot:CAMPEP_0194055224 /NCGR_PEP_ID=MMETSP0009_2-20130614/55971_1 /TAXON_ID=210454 /ORGANISM="Grammatophora oceanica, Strain CCMP 410" /LENGTH=434 /DNA_ID=CAMNT_0038704049 /DNA_START=78 /DNA_END=1382 /DNA_ORIENTATION=-
MAPPPDHEKVEDGEFPTERKDGFVPGVFVVTSNIPGATYNRDGSLCEKKVCLCHKDFRTSGGSVVIPWAQFDKRDGEGGGYFDWDFVDQQMEPWLARGQVVNLLVWPAVQKKDQLFPNGGSATPDYIMDQDNMTYQCPDGSAQFGCCSEGIPLPKFWKPEVFQKYGQALKQFVRRYEDHPGVNYFRFGIGVGAESYPGNGCTMPHNYGMSTLVEQFEGESYEEKAENAYKGWSNYAKGRVRAFRELNSKKPIVVTINNFATLDGMDKTDFPHMIAEEATKDFVGEDGVEYPKLGLGVQGATTNDAHKYKKGEMCYADWGAIFEKTKELGVPLQIQTPLHSGVNGRPGPWQERPECQELKHNNGKYGVTNTGNLAELLDFSVSVGANAFELYPYEWMVANDEHWCNKDPELNWHAKFGEQYGEALTKASNLELAK